MKIFDRMAREGHEQLVFCSDRGSGLRAVVAIHDTTLGPGLGGCRMWDYPDESSAIDDALRLAAGMTHKSAVTGFDHGGAKAVIWGDPAADKSEALFRAFGRFIESLGGRIITGTDLGTTHDDFVIAAEETRWLVGLPESHGGGGDTSEVTSFGILTGMKACAAHVYGDESLEGRTVAVQGLGKVGTNLVRRLAAEGCRVIVTDIDRRRVDAVCEEFPEAEAAAPDDIYDAPADIFSPCAMGGILNKETIPRLKCKIVAGSANNQLEEADDARRLHEAGILYAPDYIINAGGLIQVADEIQGFNRERVWRKAAGLADILRRIFALSTERGMPPNDAAETLVRRRIRVIGSQKGMFVPKHDS